MSVQAIAWVLQHSVSKGTSRCVLLSIANHVDPDGTGWVHISRVLSEANCSVDSYRRAVQEAEDTGELIRQSHAGGGARLHDRHRPNLYTFPALAGEPVAKVNTNKTKVMEQTPQVVTDLFNEWLTVCGKDPARTRLTVQRKRRIIDRLREGYSPEEISEAIHGVLLSEFHMGANDRRTVYNDLTTILRDGAQVERFGALTRASSGQLAQGEPVYPGIRKARGCEHCDGGFLENVDGTVTLCKRC